MNKQTNERNLHTLEQKQTKKNTGKRGNSSVITNKQETNITQTNNNLTNTQPI